MTFIARIAAVVLALTAVAHADENKPHPFKNVQFLKHATHAEVDMSMSYISGALGVGCDYCHVTAKEGPWPMEKDDKQAKRTARKMMVMAAKINKDFFGGDKVVTCVTCHKGHAEPPETVSLATVWPEHEASPAEGDEAKPATVTVQEVLDNYLQGSGGKAAWEKLHTRVAKGKIMFGPTREMPLEVDVAAPDKFLATVAMPGGTMEQGFDGTVGWRKSRFGVGGLEGMDRADSARDGLLAPPLALAGTYTGLKALPDATVGKAAAHVLEGHAFGVIEKLYFDAKSGLLVRRLARMATPLGDLAEQIDYEDWKTVDGVMVPFTIKRNTGGEVQMEKFTSIQHNVAVDDKRFARPEK